MTAVKRFLEIVAVIVVSIAIGVAVVFLAGRFNAEADTTNGAAWVEAFATLGALVAATAAAIFAARVYILESRRDDRFLKAEHEKQAALIAVWGTLEALRVAQDGRIRIKGATSKLQARNASPLPVTSVTIHIWVAKAVKTATGQLAIEEDVELFGPVDHSTFLPPADKPIDMSVSLPPSVFEQMDALLAADPKAEFVMLLTVEFVDAVGTRWRRDRYGKLRDITDEPVQ